MSIRQRWTRTVVALAAWFCLVFVVALAAATEKADAVADPSPGVEKTGTPDAVDIPASSRAREGSKLVDELGEFQKSGERAIFYRKGGQMGIRVLENLALERVMRHMELDPVPRVWSISGIMTEFRGENYLLLTHVVLKSRTSAEPRPMNPRGQLIEKNESTRNDSTKNESTRNQSAKEAH